MNRDQKQKLAVSLGLPPDAPDNVLHWWIGGMKGINDATAIKAEYDSNNPPVQVGATSADREKAHEPPPPPPQL